MNIIEAIERIKINSRQMEKDRLALMAYIGAHADEHGAGVTARVTGLPYHSFRTYLRPELRKMSAIRAAELAEKILKKTIEK